MVIAGNPAIRLFFFFIPLRTEYMRMIRSVPTLCILILALAFASPGRGTEKDGAKKSSLFALPTAYYSTDTGFGYGAAGIYGYHSSERRVSQLMFSIINTVKHQFQATVKWDHSLPGDRYRLLAEMKYARYPLEFFGLGNDTSNKDPHTYTPEFTEGVFSLERLLASELRLQAGVKFRNQALVKRDENNPVQNPSIPWGTGRLDGGAVLALLWDSRDNTTAATRGSLFKAEYTGSLLHDRGNGRELLSFDARIFRQPLRGCVLASQILFRDARGDTPFYLLPDMGGMDFLRGYEEDRFIDRSQLLMQQDFRFPVWWRFGGCVFGAVGRVAPKGGDLFSGKFHAAYGAGLRYYINRSDGLVVRFDSAFGNDSQGTYISFGEAF